MSGIFLGPLLGGTAGGPAGTVHLSDELVENQVKAFWEIRSDGFIKTNDVTTPANYPWIIPQVGMHEFEVKVHKESGDSFDAYDANPGMDVWINCGLGALRWGYNGTGAQEEGVFSVEVRRVSDAVVVGSCELALYKAPVTTSPNGGYIP